MTASEASVVDIAGLRRRGAGRDGSGQRRAVSLTLELADPEVGDSCICDGRVAVEVTLEAVSGGIGACGELKAAWRGPCRRCLADMEAPLAVDFREMFSDDPTEGETWPIVDERIDLAEPVRQAALLAIPLAPVCAPDCAGPEPGRFLSGLAESSQPDDEAEPAGDPRWAALDALRFDD